MSHASHATLQPIAFSYFFVTGTHLLNWMIGNSITSRSITTQRLPQE